MANQCVWFDIPVVDLDRAIKFYSAVLGEPIRKETFPGMTFGLLPHEGEEVGGCLVVMENGKPSDQGPLLYLNAKGRLDAAITAAQSNGGKVLQAKHQIGPYGYKAVILDSEGNRIALHSM
jgi:predicted enzyme related to lactoylglutathione lyase